jgi:ribonuclease P protein component
MIAKKFRLSLKKDFDAILKSRNKFYSYDFVLKYSKNTLSHSRFAIVISKKVSKRAVDRNTIKRRVSEIIRLNMSSIKNGFDIMIFAKSGAVQIDYQKINQEIDFLLKKAMLLK